MPDDLPPSLRRRIDHVNELLPEGIVVDETPVLPTEADFERVKRESIERLAPMVGAEQAALLADQAQAFVLDIVDEMARRRCEEERTDGYQSSSVDRQDEES